MQSDSTDMKYADFKKIKNLDLLLLLSLDALESAKHIFELDNYPDFDLSEYDKHSEQTYFFSNDLEFPDQFNTILRIDNEIVRLFSHDDLERLSKEHLVDFKEDMGYARFLAEIQKFNQDISDEGNEIDFDGFHLNSIKISGINNVEKKITILGGYSADSMWIQPFDCKLILFCDLLGIPKKSTQKSLFLGLVSEGYSLIGGGNFNLSFFILYTAIECYINTKLDAHEDQSRLSDKMQRAFKTAFPHDDLINHQIYTSIVAEFSDYTEIRNKIAHGTSAVAICENDARKLLLFALTMIASIESAIANFQDLKAKINHA